MTNRRMAIAVFVLGVSLQGATESAADDYFEVGAGSIVLGGAKLAVGVVHEVSPGVGLTATLEWSQRPWITGVDVSIDRRLAYAGVGGRLRLFPSQRIGSYVTLGLGVGHLGFPGSARPGEWHAVPWTGVGIEARLADHVYIGVEARAELLRRDGAVDGELPIRIAVRMPFGRRSGREGTGDAGR